MLHKLLVIVIRRSFGPHAMVSRLREGHPRLPRLQSVESGWVPCIPSTAVPTLKAKAESPVQPVTVRQEQQDAEGRALGERSADMTSVPARP